MASPEQDIHIHQDEKATTVIIEPQVQNDKIMVEKDSGTTIATRILAVLGLIFLLTLLTIAFIRVTTGVL
ncbi:MAG: hypothetical protein M3Q80_00450 [bacterium]|nr:hypothetical protein [bacterium]